MPGVAAQTLPSLALRGAARLEDHVINLSWSASGALCAAALVSGPITLLDEQGQRAAELPGHGAGTLTLGFSPTAPILATGGQDGVVRLWDQQGERAVLEAGAAWVERLAWSPSGEQLACAAGRRYRRFFADGRLLDEAEQAHTIADLRWLPQGTGVVTASYGALTLYPARAMKDPAPRQLPWQGSMLMVAVAPSGRFIATGNQDASVHFWTLPSGEDCEMTGFASKVRELAWDRAGLQLATGGGEDIVVWDTSGRGPQGRRPLRLVGHRQRLSALAFQRRGERLVSGCLGGEVRLWRRERRGWKTERALDLGSAITRLSFSPSDHTLAVATAAGDVVLLVVPS